MKFAFIRVVGKSVAWWAGVSGAVRAEAPDFNRDIRPIIFNNCVACHGPDEHERKAGLRLDRSDGATALLKKGGYAVVPGQRLESQLWQRVSSNDPDKLMPPPESGHTLKAEQIELLGRWIDAGAKYDGHWAFQKPVRPPVPTGHHPVDYFISQRLAKEGLALSPPADARTLTRRLFLDLTGLPPEAREASRTQNPEGATGGATRHVENLIAYLLSSPAYGERWARMWLDLARYADSRGYGSDPLRLNIWRYRDWLINAFNRNLPYDRFTIEQLAGDLLPDPTSEQLLATAFHRNTLTNTLGGTIDEEFRVVAVKDRAETTAQVWMGLTLKCAQCHTHKFDPLTNEEYYRFYAIFNQSQDSDRPDEFPTAPTPTPDEQAGADALRMQIEALRKTLAKPSAEFLAQQDAWEASLVEQDQHWRGLEGATAASQSGQPLQLQPDGSWLAVAGVESDVYSIDAPAPAQAITGLRIEALPDARLPGGGPGHDRSGNFVVNEIKLFERPKAGGAPLGRFVRLELPGDGRQLHIAEVQVFSAGKNIAPQGQGRQSSIDYGGTPERANDGNTDGDFAANSTIHTRMENNPWWEVDLGAEHRISQLTLWNRTDHELQNRLDGYVVKILDAQRKELFSQKPGAGPRPSATVAVDGRREIPLRVASASFEQEKFGAAKAIDGSMGKDSGWAIAPHIGRPHTLVLELAEPICREGGDCGLSVEISQTFSKHSLGRFRLGVTNRPAPLRALPQALVPVLAKPAATRSQNEAAEVAAFYATLDPELNRRARQVAELEKKLASLKPAETPIMRELTKDKRRVTKLMVKGNYLSTAQNVEPGIPAAFHPLTDELKRDSSGEINRLALAKWLVSRENPLTARVAVNRFWSQLFGRGLVETEEDFGTQGSYPSHPQLLDWLAVEFMESGWDVKRLLKAIVSSQTYRQSSEVSDEHLAKDPQNVLLSRGPRFRLEAEMVRDQALAISGLLNRKMFGPSVYPPQPDGLWRAAFNGERSYPTSTGEDRYRRGIYVFMRRTVPYPSLMTFDAPNRETCTLRRIRTNTPLQAFVTLNDPAFIEMARAFARRIVLEGGATPNERLTFAYRLCALEHPSPAKLQTLLELFDSEFKNYSAVPAEAKKLAEDPLHAMPKAIDWPEMAAYMLIANTLLNLDAVLTKG
ncbi:MAG: DUF1553 domain-containing protein [Verrucomicrobiales bacterium]